MRAALSWAIEHEEAELALRLGGALRWFWCMEGYYGEGRRWLEAALGKDWGAAAEARTKALEGMGWLASGQGDLDRAQAAAEEGLKLDHGSRTGGRSRGRLPERAGGSRCETTGRLRVGGELLEESLAFHREAGDIRGVAWSMGSLANVSTTAATTNRRRNSTRKVWLCLGSWRRRIARRLLISLGYEFLLEGNPERATSLNEEAVALYRKRGHRGRLQIPLDNLGWAALVRNDYQQAKALHEESLELCKELGDKLIGSESIEGLACSAAARGEAERAAILFGAAGRYARR